MIAPRWRKVLADIAEHPLRAALAVLAMAAGVFGVGFILSAYAVLGRELARTFEETRPASAVLLLDRMSPGLVDSVRAMPGVADAEGRAWLPGQLRNGDHTAPMMLFVVSDFADLRLDRFVHEAGAWPPSDDAILVERSALSVTGARIGDRVTAKTSGLEAEVTIAGTVHAAGLAPGWMDHVVTGFIGPNSVLLAGSGGGTPALRFLVAERAGDRAHIRIVADAVRSRVEAAGYAVRRVDIPEPGRHPHAAQMDTFLFLLGAFGALALVLSAIVVASLIHALVAEQVRQIGVMKSLGARDGQVAALYLGQVALLALAALAIGIPAGLAGGRAYAAFAANMLNANVVSQAVPMWVFAVQALVGLGVPLLVALVPVRRASRVTVREALADRGVSGPAFGTRRLERALLALPGLPRPLALWLRSTLQRRARLALTVATLAMGGAVFIAAINVSAAWKSAIARDGATKVYDLDVRFPRATSAAQLQGILGALPAVSQVEFYPSGAADLVGSLGGESERVALLGAAPGSPRLAPRLIAGRWLRAGDDSAVAVNQAALRAVPGLALGDSLKATIRGRTLAWPIVGVVKELHPGPAAYALPAAVRAATGDADSLARGARVVLAGHDDAAQRAGQASLQSALEGAGLEGAGITRLLDQRKAFADHLVIIYTALYLAAALVVLVGGIGLTSTLLLNVFERTREIGVLRAIGAAPRVIAQNVVIEGVTIGVLSWFVALVATIPATLALDALTGKMFVNAPVDFVFSAEAAGAWLLLVVVLAALGSVYPAWRAARLTVREALAHE